MRLPPFQVLIDAHGRDLHRFLLATAGPAAAEDCLQETWLAALRTYPRLRSDANLRGWLLTIAHRKAIDHIRASQRRPVPVGTAAEDGRRQQPPEPPDDDLWQRVRELPPRQRHAVALRYALDAPHAEVARLMGTSEAAARRSVHEGLKRLRQELER